MSKALAIVLAVFLATNTVQAQVALPSTTEPATVPPPSVVLVPSPGPTTGQWLYTNQYGWIWAPWGNSYVNANGSVATEYFYWPGTGWGWYASSWVLGVGVQPFFGRLGWAHYGWWGHRYSRSFYHNRWHRR